MNDPDIGSIAFAWWRLSLGDHASGRRQRAALRRATTVTDALLVDATHDLNRALDGNLKRRPEVLALMAISLAHVRSSNRATIAERMRRCNVSNDRFQRLMRITAPADLIVPMTRTIRHVEATAQIHALARDLYYWNENTRNQWCFGYYGAGSRPVQQLMEIE